MRFLVITALALAPWALPAQSRRVTPILGSDGKRVALVVGNDSYQTLTPLHNAANDASDMAAALRAANFQVQTVVNGTRERIDLAVDSFVRSLGKGDVALFYYSGHAMQINGDNYLAPVDLQAANEVLARNRSIKATEILEEMESSGADLQIMVLDACRDNPFGGQRSIRGKGLAPMNAGKGTFLAYATAPGRSADDNRNGSNGLYTTHLLQALREPGLTLEQVFKLAGGEVQRASSGAQIPWTSSSVDGDFYFHAPTGAGVAPPPAPVIDLDQERYTAVKDSRDPDQLEQAAARMQRRDLAEILIERAKSLRSQTVVRQPDPAPYTPPPTYAPVNVAEPFRTGFAQWGADQYGAAVNSFTQAIRQGDNTAEAYRFRGLSYRHLGRNSEALADFDQAMRLGDTAAAANRADLAKEMGIAAPASRYTAPAPAPAQRTYQPSPPVGNSSFETGMNLYVQSRYGECVAAFSAVIRDDPNNSDAWRYRGLCYKHEGDNASALSDFNQALRLGNGLARSDIANLGK